MISIGFDQLQSLSWVLSLAGVRLCSFTNSKKVTIFFAEWPRGVFFPRIFFGGKTLSVFFRGDFSGGRNYHHSSGDAAFVIMPLIG